ncbi:hypothetical protein B4119_1501 [Parageobacillus caldoxylosilyticus]|uniref:Uncharacterized protein n=1 Tax=Saccharococcus caldoxylosilyticus TaxID=81408 RepID=A0A150LQG1_9BACL|nr:hypothetical protein B4119_1501 [Parageobacillus caldoxylosilyticus]
MSLICSGVQFLVELPFITRTFSCSQKLSTPLSLLRLNLLFHSNCFHSSRVIVLFLTFSFNIFIFLLPIILYGVSLGVKSRFFALSAMISASFFTNLSPIAFPLFTTPSAALLIEKRTELVASSAVSCIPALDTGPIPTNDGCSWTERTLSRRSSHCFLIERIVWVIGAFTTLSLIGLQAIDHRLVGLVFQFP